MKDILTSATTEQRIRYMQKHHGMDAKTANRCRYSSKIITKWLAGHYRFFIYFINRSLGSILYKKNQVAKDTGLYPSASEPTERTEDYLSLIMLDALAILYNYDLNSKCAPLSYIGVTLQRRSADYVSECIKNQAYGGDNGIQYIAAPEAVEEEELELSDRLGELWDIIRETYGTSRDDARKVAVKFSAPSMQRSLKTKGTPIFLRVASWVALIIGYNALFTYSVQADSSSSLQPSHPLQEMNSSLVYLTLLRLPLNSA